MTSAGRLELFVGYEGATDPQRPDRFTPKQIDLIACCVYDVTQEYCFQHRLPASDPWGKQGPMRRDHVRFMVKQLLAGVSMEECYEKYERTGDYNPPAPPYSEVPKDIKKALVLFARTVEAMASVVSGC